MTEQIEISRVRAILWEWGAVEKRVDELTEQMRSATRRCREVDEEIGGSAPPDGQPRSTTPGDPVFRQFEAREKLREIYTQEIEECSRQIAEVKRFQASINAIVATLRPVEQDVLRERYVKGDVTWLYIGFKMHMDERTARRIEHDACEKLARKMAFD